MISRRRAGFKQPCKPETRTKISQTLKGFKVKEETKSKISTSMKDQHATNKRNTEHLRTEKNRKFLSDLKKGNENNPTAKIKWDNIPVIFQQLNSGIKVAEVAKAFNVSISTIRDIKAGKRWVVS